MAPDWPNVIAGNERVSKGRLLRRIPAAIAVLLLPACDFGMYRGGSTQGHAINGLYQVLFWFAIPIAVIVYGLILWSVFRYRRRRGDDGSLPKQFRYHLPMELTYTAVPVVIVVVLFGFTLSTMNKVDTIAAKPVVTVDATGFRWQWRFELIDNRLQNCRPRRR